ncbi:HAD family hydrolase [Halostagnicola kamekurae]|uniref:Haloacid dehalogenase superfamily, subfamily IA, variant 3 with third motif having DD or ED n=1 Tax=Halostagnicola kamekurae TaxID=619731 RepID=A0A1I6P330_9EURY|nr:HAD family phosphatase [Halostagnicola kamekurae]SFS34565.1 haloacid dehalogenase superfamily, subfamily IA, variant 3 with third motif having DD or ED [Halostagnicola kamekurae]
MTAVLFDMDGVIIDSEDYWVEREREHILPMTVPDETVPVAEISGMNYRETYEYLESNYETAISRERFVEVFAETAREIYSEHVSLLPGFHDHLEKLHDRDVTVALVTSSPHDWIEIVFDRFDLEGRFDEIVSGEDIEGPGKPHPYIFEEAATKVNREPGDCVAVEDSENGVRSAARAGTHTVAYRIDAHTGLDLSPADSIVETPRELRETVLEQVE